MERYYSVFTDIELIMLRESSPPEFLKLLYGKIGQDGFEDSKKLNAYIADLLVDSSGIKQRIRYAITCNIQNYILREPVCLLEKVRLQQIALMIKNQTGMSDEAAEEFVYLFAYATGRISSYLLNKTYYSCLHPVKVGGKYGYADEKNQVVIVPRYDRAKPFSYDRAKVFAKGKYGFIDRAGEEVIQLIYDKANDFTGKTTEVVLNGETLIIDLDGRIVR